MVGALFSLPKTLSTEIRGYAFCYTITAALEERLVSGQRLF